MLLSGIWSFAGTTLVMLVLLYFLLASNYFFLRKLVKVSLPCLDDKRRSGRGGASDRERRLAPPAGDGP